MTMPGFITDNLEAILEDWDSFAAKAQPDAVDLTPEGLRDCAEEMLLAIARNIESGQPSDKSRELTPDPDSRMEDAARRHAADRWAQTFTPKQLIAEFRALRAIVVHRWKQYQTGSDSSELAELIRFNEAVDELMAISMAWYESALEASETRYRTLFEAIDEGFCVIEMLFDEHDRPSDYRFLETNPAFDLQTGLENVAGKRMRELEPQHEDHWFETYGRVSQTGQPERFTQAAEGRWFDVYAFPVGNADQRKVGVVFRDISEQRQLEHDRREENRSKDEFLALLGHELRNPMAPLQTGLDLLDSPVGGATVLDTVVPLMRRQLAHLVRLVDDLLDIARVSYGKIELQRDAIDLGEPVRAAIEQARTLVENARHDLHVEMAGEHLPVHGDFERLTQVVANLLNNAAKYTDPGGTITVTVGQQDGHAFVSVRDTGLGLSQTDMKGLFKLFKQIADHQGNHSGGGLGVGLALSRQLVELHDGSIEARSAGRGYGSEFVFRLPLMEGAFDGASRAAVDPTPSGLTFRVLVVDDNQDAAESLRMLLEAGGHTVETAYDGGAALERVKEFQPDVLLLDLGLPDMDGLEVAGRVRAMPDSRDLHIVAVTGWGQDDDKIRTRAAGFNGHLTKPVDAKDLASVFESLGRTGA